MTARLVFTEEIKQLQTLLTPPFHFTFIHRVRLHPPLAIKEVREDAFTISTRQSPISYPNLDAMEVG